MAIQNNDLQRSTFLHSSFPTLIKHTKKKTKQKKQLGLQDHLKMKVVGDELQDSRSAVKMM